ncbi:MAG: HpcH/HpaI aldolase/citrate lyase family protein [Hyphomicrobiaceae bacterium]
MFRSMLFVPATNDKFIAKAATRGADAIILDLEDSIPPTEKLAAREALALAVPQCRAPHGEVWVRVNRPFRLCVQDLEAAVAAGADGIMLPKAESAEHVRFVAEVLGEVELEFGRPNPTQIFTIIETAKAVLDALSIVSADARVAIASTGNEDLATELGARPLPATMRTANQLVHLAAKSAGRASFGLFGSIADFTNLDAMRAMVEEARMHGFDGATCIHPAVVPILNAGFMPQPDEVNHARRIVEAFDAAERAGSASINVDGKMIDIPVVERARRIVATAERWTD